MNIGQLKEYIRDLPDNMEIAYMDFGRKEEPDFRIHNNELNVE